MSQTVLWFTETSALSEEIGLNLSKPQALKTLLQAHRQLGTLSTGEFLFLVSGCVKVLLAAGFGHNVPVTA